MPVREETRLQFGYSGTFHPDVVVPPYAPGQARAVPLLYVHAAEVAYLAVYDHHFAVIAIIGNI